MVSLQWVFPYLFLIIKNEFTALHSGEFRESTHVLNVQEKQNVLWTVHTLNQTLIMNIFSIWYVLWSVFYISELFIPNTVVICEWRKIKVLIKNKKSYIIQNYIRIN